MLLTDLIKQNFINELNTLFQKLNLHDEKNYYIIAAEGPTSLLGTTSRLYNTKQNYTYPGNLHMYQHNLSSTSA